MGDHGTKLDSIFAEAIMLQGEGRFVEAGARCEDLIAALDASDRSGALYEQTILLLSSAHFEQHNYFVAQALITWVVNRTTELRTAVAALQNLAHCYREQGAYDASMALFAEIAEIAPRGNVIHRNALIGSAKTAFGRGDYRGAISLYDNVIAALAADSPVDSRELGFQLQNQADCLAMLGEHDRSAATYRSAEEYLRPHFALDHPLIIDLFTRLVGQLHGAHRYAEASELYGVLIQQAHLTDSAHLELDKLRFHKRLADERMPSPKVANLEWSPPQDALEGLKSGHDQREGQLLEECIRAFLAHDYASAAAGGLTLARTRQGYEVTLLTGLAIMRLGMADVMAQYAGWAMHVSAGNPYQTLLAVAFGLTEADDALPVVHRFGLQGAFAYLLAPDTPVRLSTKEDRSASLWDILTYVDSILPIQTTRAVDYDMSALMEQLYDATHSGEMLEAISREIEDPTAEVSPERLAEFEAAVARQDSRATWSQGSLANAVGNMHYHRGNVVEAIREYRRALGLLADLTDATEQRGILHANLANALAQEGHYRDAESHYRQAVELYGSDTSRSSLVVTVCLDEVEFLGGHVPRVAPDALRIACAAVQRGIRRRLRTWVANETATINDVLDTGDIDLANALVRKLHLVLRADSAPNPGYRAVRMLAAACSESSEYDSALSVAQWALSLASSDEQRVAVIVDAAGYALAAGDLAQTERLMTDAAGLEVPDDLVPAVTLTRARLEIATGEESSAAERLSDLLKSGLLTGDSGLDAAIRSELAIIQARRGDRRAAMTNLEVAIAARPLESRAALAKDLHSLARLKVDAREFEEAARLVDRAERLEGVHGGRSGQFQASACLIRSHIARAREQPFEALASARAAQAALAADSEAPNWLRRDVYRQLGDLATLRGALVEAAQWRQEAARHLGATESPSWRVGMLAELAASQLAAGDLGSASATIAEAGDLVYQGVVHDPLVEGLVWLYGGITNARLGATATARTLLERSVRLFDGLDQHSEGHSYVARLWLAQVAAAEEDWSLVLTATGELSDSANGLGLALQARAHLGLGDAPRAFAVASQRFDLALANVYGEPSVLMYGHRGHPLTNELNSAEDFLHWIAHRGGLLSEPAVARTLFEAAVVTRRLVTDVVAAMSRYIARHADASDRAKWIELNELRQAAAYAAMRDPTRRMTADEAAQLESLQRRLVDLEVAVSDVLTECFRSVSAQSIVFRFNLETLLDRMRPGSAVLVYVKLDPTEHSRRLPTGLDDGRYLLLLAAKAADGQTSIWARDLGPATDVDKLANAHAVGMRSDCPSESRLQDIRSQLASLLLPAEIKDVDRALISTDGSIHLVPFEALPIDGDRLVLDTVTCIHVDSFRSLLAERPAGPSTQPVVVADPDFDLQISPRDETSTTPSKRFFSRLEGTAAEAVAIQGVLPVEVLAGAAAVKARVKAVTSPRYLHLATHGFFVAPPSPDAQRAESVHIIEVPGEGSFVAEIIPSTVGGGGLVDASRLDNPLLRSGLALAGANTSLSGGRLPLEAGDGLLTAADATGLDLAGTELVVLSACETALGVADSAEGVVGLRQAFTIAGASSVVASLWPVPDAETAALMKSFYGHLVSGQGEEIEEALRRAKLEMRHLLPDVSWAWAAFIVIGTQP